MLKIVADSTCNLPDEFIQKHDIRIAPISIQFGEETYEEGIGIDRPTFYRKIEEMGIIPTTSQPTPAWFAKYYRELHEAGHEILVITVTSKHSGTFDSAIMAKDMVPEAEVVVFDSLSISLATAWIIVEAVRGIEAGWGREKILSRMEAIRAGTQLFITPKTLKYLQMSGRVGRLQNALGSLLDLKPIIAVEEGVLEAIENVRTRRKAKDRLIELLQEKLGEGSRINGAVIHAQAPEEGEELRQGLEQAFDCNELLTGDLVASLAVHGGPGILGVVGYWVIEESP